MTMNASTFPSLPLSNLQLELLHLYASNVSDEDLLKIRELLARFFLEKAKDAGLLNGIFFCYYLGRGSAPKNL